MGGVFRKKKWKMGFFVTKWTFPQRRVHCVQYQYFFLFYILLIWGYVHTQRTPLPTGLEVTFPAQVQTGGQFQHRP